MRNTYALLIAGDEPRASEETEEFQRYLIDEANFNPRMVQTMFVRAYNDYYLLDQVKNSLWIANTKAPNEPKVLIYCGGGAEGGICPVTKDSYANITYAPLNRHIRYEKLGGLFCDEERVLFINNCPYSGSAIPIFTNLGILPKRGSVIASAGSKELSSGESFQNTLIDAFRQRKPYRKRKILFRPETRYEKRIATLEQKFNPVSGRWENKGEKIVEHWYKTSPAITQHPQRCGLSLDHLLFPL